MAGSLGRLFAELRRRRVWRVLIVYAIAGWLVIQVAATVLPSLHLPEWAVTLVVALVVLGLPIALAMAWMFDAGPRGLERTPPMSADPAPVVAPLPDADSAPTRCAHAAADRRSGGDLHACAAHRAQPPMAGARSPCCPSST